MYREMVNVGLPVLTIEPLPERMKAASKMTQKYLSLTTSMIVAADLSGQPHNGLI